MQNVLWQRHPNEWTAHRSSSSGFCWSHISPTPCPHFQLDTQQTEISYCYSNQKITRISIQTTGLAFGGSGLCSYHVRGVDGICAEHLPVVSYVVFICQQSYLLLFGIPSPTHSFIPGLKPSFSANPSHCSPSFLLLKYSLQGFPGLFTVISEHICFSTFSFSVFTLFSCRFRAVD